MYLKVEFIKQSLKKKKKALPHSSLPSLESVCCQGFYHSPPCTESVTPLKPVLCLYSHTVQCWLTTYFPPTQHILDLHSPDVVLSHVHTTAPFDYRAAAAALLGASAQTHTDQNFLLRWGFLLKIAPIGWLLLVLFFLILLLSPLGQSNWEETNFNLWLLFHLLVFHTCWEVRGSCVCPLRALLHSWDSFCSRFSPFKGSLYSKRLNNSFLILSSLPVLLYLCQDIGLSRAVYDLGLSNHKHLGWWRKQNSHA